MIVEIIPLDQSKAHVFDQVSGVPQNAVISTFDGGKSLRISFAMEEGDVMDQVSARIDSSYYTCGGPDSEHAANHLMVVVRAEWDGVPVQPKVVGNGGVGCNISVEATDVGYTPAGMCDQLDPTKHTGQLETWGDNVDYDCNGHVDPSNWIFSVSGFGAGWEMEVVDWSKPSPVSYAMTLDIPSGKYKVSILSWLKVTDYNIRYRLPGGAWLWSPYNWNGCHIDQGVAHEVRDSYSQLIVPFTAPANLSPAQSCHFQKL